MNSRTRTGRSAHRRRSSCAKSEPIGHRLAIDEATAEHVRLPVERYAASFSCQKIVSNLKRRAVRASRGSTRTVSAFYRSPATDSDVLNRPREEWKIVKRPELAIVLIEA